MGEGGKTVLVWLYWGCTVPNGILRPLFATGQFEISSDTNDTFGSSQPCPTPLTDSLSATPE